MDDLGTMEHRDGLDVLRFERRLAHPVEQVWAAITSPGELPGWWGNATVDLELGGRFDVQWLDGMGPRREATITALDPPHLLETTGDPHGVIRFELAPDGERATRLTFTVEMELPEEYRGQTLAGWHWHLDALEDALGGMPQAWDPENPHPGWPEIGERYGVEYPG